MIVIEGDSVALAIRGGVYPHQTWWALLPHKTVVLASPSATMSDIHDRVHVALDSKPSHYILLAGQWSHNHEPLEQFSKYLDLTIKRVCDAGVKPILITTPKGQQKFDGFDLTPYVAAVMACSTKYMESGCALVDLHDIIEKFDIYDSGGLHLGVAGNKLLADNLWAHFE